jgi:hypothetical protein
MKKFTIKFSIMFLIILVSLLILNQRYVNTNNWKYQNETEKFYHIPQNIQIANFGSSNGLRDFVWIDSEYTAFNFGLGAQVHYFDYMLLQQYIDHFAQNAVVIFPITYGDVSSIHLPDSNMDLIPRYYRILDKQYNPQYKWFDNIRFNTFPILSAGYNIASVVNDYDPTPWLDDWINGSMLNKTDEWILEVNNSSKALSEGTEGYFYNKKNLCDIIEYCLLHNLQPVILATPYAGVLNDFHRELSPDFFEAFERFAKEICEQYPTVPYLDYSNDIRISPDLSLFYDHFHLNYHGAQIFTPMVVSDIEKLGLLGVDGI